MNDTTAIAEVAFVTRAGMVIRLALQGLSGRLYNGFPLTHGKVVEAIGRWTLDEPGTQKRCLLCNTIFLRRFSSGAFLILAYNEEAMVFGVCYGCVESNHDKDYLGMAFQRIQVLHPGLLRARIPSEPAGHA